MMTRPHDTRPEAWGVHHALLDRMDGSARIRAAIELSEAVRAIRLSGIQARDESLDAREALAQLIREDYGLDLSPGS